MSPIDRRTARVTSRGMTLIETIVGLGIGTIVVYGIYSLFVSYRLSRQPVVLAAMADRANHLLLDQLDGYFRFRVVRVEPAANDFTFALMPPAPLVMVDATQSCYGLRIRGRVEDGSFAVMNSMASVITKCGDALGVDPTVYEQISSVARCPSATPRPVVVTTYQRDENDASGLQTWEFPGAAPLAATKFEVGKVNDIIATEACATPVRVGTEIKSVRVVVTSLAQTQSGKVVVRTAQREYPTGQVLSETPNGAAGIWVKEYGRLERIKQ